MASTSSLQDKRIVVTRAQAQADAMSQLLRDEGASVIEVPLIETRPLLTREQARPILSRLDQFAWVIFTSANAIRYFFDLEPERDRLDQVRIACVGDKTADRLAELYRQPDFVPPRFTSQFLAEQLEIEPGAEVLYPCPRGHSGEMVESLEAKQARVTSWPLYETVPQPLDEESQRVLAQGLDAITFASPSAVDSLCDQVEDMPERLADSVIACIGPMTRRRAVERGLRVDVMPDDYNARQLVDALKQYFADRHSQLEQPQDPEPDQSPSQ